VRELPILFTTFSVLGMLARRKTQTRRLIKLQPVKWDTVKRKPFSREDMPRVWSPLTGHSEDRICPYGVGQRLWVRETTESYRLPILFTGEPSNAVGGRYVADKDPVLNEHGFDFAWWHSKPRCPAIFMPRYACRITIKVTRVGVERVQDISVEDCIAEGCTTKLREQEACDELRDQYHRIWDAINGASGANSWEANPWVWVFTFLVDEVRGG